MIKNMDYYDIETEIITHLYTDIDTKNEYSEAFTPINLIEELLDKLDNEVWSNPNLKWLEPANGVGNFPMVVFDRLNKSLSNVILDEEERKTHIIKNMLYMVELNEENVKISQYIFGDDANIYCGSFLDDGWKEAFGIDKFDLIIGNPPFNGKKYKRNLEYGTRANVNIWNEFIKKSLENLKYDGYLCFIIPQTWRSVSTKFRNLWKIMSNKQITYLRIYGVNDCIKFFNVSFKIDLFIMKNRENNTETEIIDELGETHHIRLNELPFLANYAYDDINKILVNDNEEGIDVIFSYTKYFIWSKRKICSKIKTNEHKYPVVHTINKDGVGLWYAKKDKKGHIGVAKVILNFNGIQYSYKEQNDYEGKYGMSQISFGIPISSKEEGDLILDAIQTPTFKKILASTKWKIFQTDYRMFRYFKKDWYKLI